LIASTTYHFLFFVLQQYLIICSLSKTADSAVSLESAFIEKKLAELKRFEESTLYKMQKAFDDYSANMEVLEKNEEEMLTSQMKQNLSLSKEKKLKWQQKPNKVF
jgi:predicted nucleotidyltransferase component of viral defense system